MPTTDHDLPSHDGLQARLACALREVALHAPPAPPVPSEGRRRGAHANTSRPGQRDADRADGVGWVRARALAKPVMAAAAVITIVGVGAIGAQQWTGSAPDENADMGPAESGGTAPTESKSGSAVTAGSRVAVDQVAARLMGYDGEPGFGRVVVDYDLSTVQVLWKGKPPAEVAEMAGSQPNGIRVIIQPSTYSQAELAGAAQAIMTAPPSQVDGAQIVAAVPNSDLSGLIVEVLKPWNGSAAALERAAGGVPTKPRLVDKVTELDQG